MRHFSQNAGAILPFPGAQVENYYAEDYYIYAMWKNRAGIMKNQSVN